MTEPNQNHPQPESPEPREKWETPTLESLDLLSNTLTTAPFANETTNFSGGFVGPTTS